jgi:hypothetical protein
MPKSPLHPCAYDGCSKLSYDRYCVRHAEMMIEENKNKKPYISKLADVTIVAGPPGSGKSTYVTERAVQGDLIWDQDSILQRLGNYPDTMKHPGARHLIPFALAMREALISELTRPHGVERAWLIIGGANLAERKVLTMRLNATVIIMDTPPEECFRRIKNDPSRLSSDMEEWKNAIGHWTYEFRES